MPRLVIEYDTMEDARNAYEDVFQATMNRNPLNNPIITIEEVGELEMSDVTQSPYFVMLIAEDGSYSLMVSVSDSGEKQPAKFYSYNEAEKYGKLSILSGESYKVFCM